MGASAPPDFDSYTYTMSVGVVTKTRNILSSPPLSKNVSTPLRIAGLRRYFKPVAALPTSTETGIGDATETDIGDATETGIGEVATTAGNKAVQQAAVVVKNVRPTLLSPTNREPR